MFALSVSMFGQMTAGSYCYIGPQGIVHGTTVSDSRISFAFALLFVYLEAIVFVYV